MFTSMNKIFRPLLIATLWVNTLSTAEIFSDVVNDIHQQNYFNFQSDEDFYDFDSFLNFGNKFDSSEEKSEIDPNSRQPLVVRSPTPAPVLGHILETLKPAARSRQRVQTKRGSRPVATTPRARSRTPRPSAAAPTASTVTQLKSADWAVTPFERFDSFLDTRKSVKDEWYPWGSGASSDSAGHTVADHLTPPNPRGSSRRNYSNDKTVTKKYDNTTAKPILNLNNLDKTAVREICETTRMKDVKYLCKQYSLNSKSNKKVQRLKRLKTKKLKTQKKPLKILPKKDTAKFKQIKRKRQHSSGTRRHLYFEADSFRPRRSEASLLDSLTSLLWPGSLVRAPVTLTAASEVKQPSPGRRSGHSLAPARGWLQGVLATYSLVS